MKRLKSKEFLALLDALLPSDETVSVETLSRDRNGRLLISLRIPQKELKRE